MRKLTSAALLAAMASAMTIRAAPLEWSASIGPESLPCTSMLDGSEVQGYTFWVTAGGYLGNGDCICIGGRLGTTEDGKLVAVENQFAYGALGVSLVLADVGSVVDYDSTVLSPALMRYGCEPVANGNDTYGTGVATGDYAVDLSDGKTAYLAFAQNNLPGELSPADTPNYYYGWIRVGLENGAPVVREFGADLTGASVRIVAVPEPSAAGLAALGAALLALRRRTRR